MCALIFFTCTHIHNSTLPSWADSDNTIAFVSEVLKLEPMDFLVKFEQWACARTKGAYFVPGHYIKTDDSPHSAGSVQENLQTMRCDCTCLILDGLCTLSM